MQNFGSSGVPSHYESGSCKTISTSWNPIELIKNPSLFSVGLVLVILLLVVLVVFLVRKLVGVNQRRRGGYRRRRFL